MPQRKGKKSLIYFFLFIIVVSIHNINFNKIKFDNIKNINISGLENSDNSALHEQIQNLNLGNIFFINQDEIEKILDSNTLIEKYYVYKNYPSTIDIKIIRTKFLAKINYENKIYLVGSNGKLTSKKFHDKYLPFIFGKPEVNDFLHLKKIIDQSKFRYDQILNFYFFPSKRWDLELKSKVFLKLPEKNIKQKLDDTYKLLNDQNFKNIKIIDARIKNQIILND